MPSLRVCSYRCSYRCSYVCPRICVLMCVLMCVRVYVSLCVSICVSLNVSAYMCPYMFLARCSPDRSPWYSCPARLVFGGEGGEEGRGGTTSIRKTFTPTKHTVTPEHPLTHTTTVHAHCILVFIENIADVTQAVCVHACACACAPLHIDII